MGTKSRIPQPGQAMGQYARQSGSNQGKKFVMGRRTVGQYTRIGDSIPVRLAGGTKPSAGQIGTGSRTKNASLPSVGQATFPGTNTNYVGQSGPIVVLPLQLPQFTSQAGQTIGGGVITTPQQFKQIFGVLPTLSTAPTVVDYSAFDGTGGQANFPSLAGAQAWIATHKLPGRRWAIYANYSDGTRKSQYGWQGTG